MNLFISLRKGIGQDDGTFDSFGGYLPTLGIWSTQFWEPVSGMTRYH